jgi:hypothetical protein
VRAPANQTRPGSSGTGFRKPHAAASTRHPARPDERCATCQEQVDVSRPLPPAPSSIPKIGFAAPAGPSSANGPAAPRPPSPSPAAPAPLAPHDSSAPDADVVHGYDVNPTVSFLAPLFLQDEETLGDGAGGGGDGDGDGEGEATGDAGALLKRARRFGQDSKSMIIPKDLWDKVRLRLWLCDLGADVVEGRRVALPYVMQGDCAHTHTHTHAHTHTHKLRG